MSKRFNFQRCLFGVLLLLSLGISTVHAQLRLVWDPNIEEDLAGYRVYFADFYRVYPPVDMKLANSHSLTNLDAETTYWIYVTAYNTNGFESEPSMVLQFPSGGCNFTIYPKSTEVSPWSSVGHFRVIAASGCSWNAVSTADWITATTQTGQGMTDIYFTVAQNTSFESRTGAVQIADQIFQVTQSAAGIPIILNPVPSEEQLLFEGDTFDVSVSATEQTELHYQWLRDGEPVSGATNSYLTIFAILPEEQGDYSVVVSSAAASITNGIVPLHVYARPRIGDAGQPRDTAVLLGGPAYLTVAATGPDLNYEWRKDGKVTAFNTRDVFIPAVTQADLGIYQVTVTNRIGSVVSRPAKMFAGTEAQLTGKIEITSSPSGPENIVIQGNGIPGEKYEIQASTDLVQWLPLEVVTVQSTGRFEITVPNPSTVVRWFVRTIREP